SHGPCQASHWYYRDLAPDRRRTFGGGTLRLAETSVGIEPPQTMKCSNPTPANASAMAIIVVSTPALAMSRITNRQSAKTPARTRFQANINERSDCGRIMIHLTSLNGA